MTKTTNTKKKTTSTKKAVKKTVKKRQHDFNETNLVDAMFTILGKTDEEATDFEVEHVTMSVLNNISEIWEDDNIVKISALFGSLMFRHGLSKRFCQDIIDMGVVKYFFDEAKQESCLEGLMALCCSNLFEEIKELESTDLIDNLYADAMKNNRDDDEILQVQEEYFFKFLEETQEYFRDTSLYLKSAQKMRKLFDEGILLDCVLDKDSVVSESFFS